MLGICLVLMVISLFLYIDIGIGLSTEYLKEEPKTWFSYIFRTLSVLIFPRRYFKAEHLWNGYSLLLLQKLMLFSFIVLLAFLIIGTGYNPLLK